MNIAFLGASKDLKDENFEQALCAMRDTAMDHSQKKLAVLKLISVCRETPQPSLPAQPQQA